MTSATPSGPNHRSGSWVTIGSFDGVHLGHQQLLQSLISEAHIAGASAVVVTFFPHPAAVLRGSLGRYYLSPLQERIERLYALGVDQVVTLEFTRELAATSAEDFLAHLQRDLQLRQLWVGFNFALGRGREGDLPTLERLGREKFDYSVRVIPPYQIAGQVVSSSAIRERLAAGAVREAAQMLGRSYTLTGPVVHGDGRGQRIGIPTANLGLWSEQALPANGVYVTWVWVNGQRYPAVTSIGWRPTFTDTPPEIRVEALLLDVKADLYGQTIQVEFVERLRGEERFDGVEALLTQIQKDIQAARESFTHEA